MYKMLAGIHLPTRPTRNSPLRIEEEHYKETTVATLLDLDIATTLFQMVYCVIK